MRVESSLRETEVELLELLAMELSVQCKWIREDLDAVVTEENLWALNRDKNNIYRSDVIRAAIRFALENQTAFVRWIKNGEDR